jgi:hypothetical protein
MNRLSTAFLILALAGAGHLVNAETDSFEGKSPNEDSPAFAGPSAAAPHTTPNDTPSDPLIPYGDTAKIHPAKVAPKPLISMRNALDFIRQQRVLNGHGLPASFYVPPGTETGNSLRQLLVSEGVGLYDTALAAITLVEAGDLVTAREILGIYAQGAYGSDLGTPMELCALPNRDNGGAFSNFDAGTYYFFDFTNVYGDWRRWGTRWVFWSVHTGPNAWMVNAMSRFIEAERAAGETDRQLEPFLDTIKSIGAAFTRLQDPATQGGVRFGPESQFAEPGTVAPYFQINSENNLSAYVAFQMLYRVTGDVVYKAAAARILDWFQNATVWTSEGKPQRGLMDRTTGTLAMGVVYRQGRWVLQTEHPTDSAGTWAISSLGPEKIDALWGTGAAYRMWHTIRDRAGRTADFKWMKNGGALAGLDYTDFYPESESLISPEWTGGGLFALQLLIPYAKAHIGQGDMTAGAIAGMETDLATMSAFIRDHSNAYAIGPGHGGQRQGQVGFGWTAPPPEVQALCSLYLALYFDGKSDPSAWWRQPKK